MSKELKYQKCPVCDGTGLVSRPPYVAGDVIEWEVTSTAPWPCKRCQGTGTITTPATPTSNNRPGGFVVNPEKT